MPIDTQASLLLTVFSDNDQREKEWIEELQKSLSQWIDIRVKSGRKSRDLGQIVFLDSSLLDLESHLEKLDRRGRAVFLVIDEKGDSLKHFPTSAIDLIKKGRVDDVVLTPFRPLELFGKVRHYEQILMWNEVTEINSSMADIIQKLQGDLKLTERLQKTRLPKRFSEVRGFTVASRYLAGMRSGGDYFDLAESKDKSHLSLILSDSSSYGLSSAVLSVLMRVTLKLSLEEMSQTGSVPLILRKIHEDLFLTLGGSDQVSLFFGVISRENQTLRFLNRGSTFAFYALPKSGFEILPQQGAALTHQLESSMGTEAEVQLIPGSRLALVSSGFVEALGGASAVRDLFDYFRENEMVDALNELVFKVKSKLKNEDDMPHRDCTALVFDVDSRVLRLTKQEQDES